MKSKRLTDQREVISSTPSWLCETSNLFKVLIVLSHYKDFTNNVIEENQQEKKSSGTKKNLIIQWNGWETLDGFLHTGLFTY